MHLSGQRTSELSAEIVRLKIPANIHLASGKYDETRTEYSA